ncbi:hypothetical protein AGLY_013491 [Aphis glycines]|uniref:Uncharacterized protein n=1 Tax=Aphis glycines TaxID=307491 RepID=A0A6G0T7B8_APHGL|nr:hypothetical protein AGLY_013491 [Aphis glycines]
MPNIGGSAQRKRRLLESVVESQLSYAAPVWRIPSVTEVARTRAILIRPQRTAAALRVIRSYRTVSDEAALVLACMPPVDLLRLKRQYIGSRLRAATELGEQRPSKAIVKREARKTTIVAWQARRHATPKAAWTRRVIPDLARWLGRTVPRVPLTFHMTRTLAVTAASNCTSIARTGPPVADSVRANQMPSNTLCSSAPIGTAFVKP